MDVRAENLVEKPDKQATKFDSGASHDLEKVTDYIEEKELTNQNFANAISAIGTQRNQAALEKQTREKELLKISIKKEDVDLIVRELQISEAKAEQTLREHQGNIIEALISILNN